MMLTMYGKVKMGVNVLWANHDPTILSMQSKFYVKILKPINQYLLLKWKANYQTYKDSLLNYLRANNK